jgi:hypothetical protein
MRLDHIIPLIDIFSFGWTVLRSPDSLPARRDDGVGGRRERPAVRAPVTGVRLAIDNLET